MRAKVEIQNLKVWFPVRTGFLRDLYSKEHQYIRAVDGVSFEIKEEEKTSQLAKWLADKIFPKNVAYSFWKEKLKKDLVILEDDDFIQFVKTSTEVITRTRISNETGTVVPGALWTEEYLPQDTILYSLAMFTSPRVKEEEKKGIFKADTPEKEAQLVYEFFKQGLPQVIQIGGNQTIGKGFVRLKLLGLSLIHI